MKQKLHPYQLSLFNKEDNVSDCNTTVSIDPNLPKVWNKYKGGVPEGAIFIGRPSKWGNPYVIGQDGTRTEVIAKFREYLKNRPDLIQAVKKELAGAKLEGLVMARLPFESSSDPFIAARIESAKLKGYDNWYPIASLEAYIRFRQGLGRLVRRPEDKGRIYIADKRILAKNQYTSFKHFLNYVIDIYPNREVFTD